MANEIDILIIHADQDNEKSNLNEAGWVAQFKKFLELMLSQVMGSKPNIMVKAEYDNVTSPNLDNVTALIPILSKDFIQSGKCLDHLEAFYKYTSETTPGKNRIFKVLKAPLSIQEQPPRLRELLGYEMYQLDPDSGDIREYTDYFTTDAERQYWMKIVDLTYDLFELLVLDNQAKRKEVSIFKRKTIYVAETGHDLSVQRNIIKRELQRHGYHVLPNQTLPGTNSELERIIKRDLQQCTMSVHLIGSSYGEIPEGTDKSVVDIQNKIAADYAQEARKETGEFSRLIWISPNLVHASERQKSFIENIKRDVEAQEGAEILQTSLEDFKNIMREELSDPGDKPSESGSGDKYIYLIHDKIDHVTILPIIELIERSGYKVLQPDFEGELLTVRQRHIEHLKNLDAAIIYKGKVNEQWVRMKALDLLKAPGFGRKKPIMGKAIILEKGSGISSDVFKSQNLQVIEGDMQRNLESIKSFLMEVKP